MNTQNDIEFGSLPIGESFTSDGESFTKVDETFASTAGKQRFRFYADDRVTPHEENQTDDD
ncbi:hypothetical protein K227x_53260 [Rubripirellula lacrimiformis]|uniref:Uncharacterized protein n=1 Tax=Rubripirellula lacrimiformis TaxID=1930273 RepID=A0A517NIM5_9BACT|nr:hypothetical protein [Rubripirellula lacrimiformis]QDT06903.1 hypothetical protein K227x_53260 [Rubripirellula lacrimiformis]